ncbi:MAG: insulinase family protein [Bacteroidota bacterium]|nr:insulinase family protein [Bacteroidota bacterium]
MPRPFNLINLRGINNSSFIKRSSSANEGYEIVTLENGLRLIHRPAPHSEVVHCGLVINAGSRDEDPLNNGVAHFIEHTVFKGTKKRQSHHILKRIENVGGELNAFTTREKTCYYTSSLAPHASRSVELLSDIVFDSTFPEKEIAKEKRVILEEIDMYEDSPEESIYDDFYTRIFSGHPLGYNILGTRETVNGLSREVINDFIAAKYVPENIALSIVGGISVKSAERLARQFLSNIFRPSGSGTRKSPVTAPRFEDNETKDFVQTHCMMGSRAYGRHEPQRFALSLLNNILGGSGMSSRLNMAVREKHALTYGIGSHYSTYDDAGVFSIYFSCDKKNLQRCIDISKKELKKLCGASLTDRQVNTAKQQLLGQMAMSVENNSVHMQYQARSILDHGYVKTFKDYAEGIEHISKEDLVAVANEVLDPDKLSVLVYKSEK